MALGANNQTQDAKSMNAKTQHVSSLSSWIRVIKTALEANGVDGLALFRQAGMDAELLADPNARFSLTQTTRLWELAVDATEDPAFGLAVSNFVNQTTFHALGYSLIASTSLKDAFERLVRYFCIVSNAAELGFERVGDRYVFRILRLNGNQPAFAAQEALLATNLRMCRSLAGSDFNPLAVRLPRAKPENTAPYRQLFRVDVEFDSAEMSMDFAADAIELALPSANEELALHNDAILKRLLAGMSRDKLSQQVHECIIELLSKGEPSHEEVAQKLNMSLRNMQRKLRETGTSYKEILDETRKELARDYLADPAYSISEITFLLGFTDTSSFSRAFRRWEAETPSQYRSNLFIKSGR